MTDGTQTAGVSFDSDKAQWPMSYRLSQPQPDTPPRRWWNHYYFRGPQNQNVRILYSSTKTQSELIAKHFINEPVLGFDMEWPWDADKRTRLQEKIGLIQIASESKTALFHIGLHEGQTSDELIAPSLRLIIESPNIIKTGVAIMNADFKRLRDHFGLQPKGAFELSHLHRLISHGPQNPELVTTKLCALSKQVETHLGLPLWKGKVRTSNWSIAIGDSQKTYAANDAYAGFMLFHCMNGKRLAMNPAPPLPMLAETYLPFAMPKIIPLRLRATTEGTGANFTTAEQFYNSTAMKDRHLDDLVHSGMATGDASQLPNEQGPPEVDPAPLDVGSQKSDAPSRPNLPLQLYEQLVQQRKKLIIASNKSLEALSRTCPTNKSQLSQVHGFGDRKVQDYGEQLLHTVSSFVAVHGLSADEVKQPLQPTTPNKVPSSQGKKETTPLSKGSSDALYHRLVQHRKACADAKNVPAFHIASNRLLEAIAHDHPANQRELLLVKGVGKAKADEYGTAWLRIIAEFKVKQSLATAHRPVSVTSKDLSADERPNLLQPRIDDPSAKRRNIARVGRSLEFKGPLPASMSTGLSFQFSETQLNASDRNDEGHDEDGAGNESAAADADDTDDNAAFETMPMPTSSELKRKRYSPSPSAPEEGYSQTPTPAAAPVPAQLVPSPSPSKPTRAPSQVQAKSRPADLERLLLRKKLEAYVKSVVFAINPKPTQPIVTEDTIQRLVTTLPRTPHELHRIPGIQGLLQACHIAQKDLWLTFSKWTQVPGLAPASQAR
ncbi:Uu.00g026990.m01.CDS01 [Anthostomella pinea]|uniref:Uu.00g026990.m01.CDS01 n=1 Tax=Anthostomella pinea TaxID=933095 RepID=A0AAI8YCK1_9PEZI|nr:Uu.00g026990.m01.CDS01 [Anthostomella pinea]